MNKYRVYLHSKPGMWTFYEGHVDVFADDPEEAEERALDELKRTSFRDRSRGAWIIDDVQVR